MLKKAQENARARGVAIDWHQSPAEKTGLPAKEFDLIISHLAFHEFDDAQAVLREVWRLLKPGGRVIIQDIRRSSFIMKTICLSGLFIFTPFDVDIRREYRDSLNSAYTKRELEELLKESGIEGTVEARFNILAGTYFRLEAEKHGE